MAPPKITTPKPTVPQVDVPPSSSGWGDAVPPSPKKTQDGGLPKQTGFDVDKHADIFARQDVSYLKSLPPERQKLGDALALTGKPDPSPADIKKAYHKLSLKLHPDKGGSQVGFQNMQNAYERLSKNNYPPPMPKFQGPPPPGAATPNPFTPPPAGGNPSYSKPSYSSAPPPGGAGTNSFYPQSSHFADMPSGAPRTSHFAAAAHKMPSLPMGQMKIPDFIKNNPKMVAGGVAGAAAATVGAAYMMNMPDGSTPPGGEDTSPLAQPSDLKSLGNIVQNDINMNMSDNAIPPEFKNIPQLPSEEMNSLRRPLDFKAIGDTVKKDLSMLQHLNDIPSGSSDSTGGKIYGVE